MVLGVVATVLLTACFVTRGELTRFVADTSESADVAETQQKVLLWSALPMVVFFYVFRGLVQ